MVQFLAAIPELLAAIPELFSSIGAAGTAGAAGAAEGATAASALGEAAGAAGASSAGGGSGLMGTLSSLASGFGNLSGGNGDWLSLFTGQNKKPSSLSITTTGKDKDGNLTVEDTKIKGDSGLAGIASGLANSFSGFGAQAGSQPTSIQAPSAASAAPLQQAVWQRNQPINFWRNRNE